MTADSSIRLQNLVERMNVGDLSARNDVIAHACDRLRRLARKMLHQDFGRLCEVEQTDDVLNGAMLRLHRALEDPNVRPASAAELFRLASVQLRRELIDLARHYFGPAHLPLTGLEAQGGSADACSPNHGPAETTFGPDRLLAWREFHDRVAALPAEERAVFELLWYQELTQAEAAVVLGVSVPTIKRRWLQARLLLQEALPNSGLNW
jgi:RNA polymerase sigma-70 factor (ECF subfamily)